MARLNRYGDPIEDDAEELDQATAHACINGWLGEDYAGRPIPCLRCRPHLARRKPA